MDQADGRAEVDVAGLVLEVDVAGLVPLVEAMGVPLVAGLVVDEVVDVLVEFEEDVEVRVVALVEFDEDVEIEVVVDLLVLTVPEPVMVEPIERMPPGPVQVLPLRQHPCWPLDPTSQVCVGRQ
ncbi:MAG: hypothetical protein M1832_005189 [Thelocarpon impressellum]|nr:MAG: hypothetical protein M1832_005189 [Thelocarpon impressellum]